MSLPAIGLCADCAHSYLGHALRPPQACLVTVEEVRDVRNGVPLSRAMAACACAGYRSRTPDAVRAYWADGDEQEDER